MLLLIESRARDQIARSRHLTSSSVADVFNFCSMIIHQTTLSSLTAFPVTSNFVQQIH
jgi:hypothetical protein